MSKKYILSFSLLIFLTISCTKDQETATPENQIEESVESTIKKQPKVIPPETKSPAPPKFSIHEAARRGNLEEIKKEEDKLIRVKKIRREKVMQNTDMHGKPEKSSCKQNLSENSKNSVGAAIVR